MSRNQPSIDWLSGISWRDAWFTMEALEPATLPPWLGSTVRGALGYLFRSTFCDGTECEDRCQNQELCRYYRLFEKTDGSRPFLIMAPPLPGLEGIAMGGEVHRPYRTVSARNGEPVPTLICEAGWKLDSGATLRFGLRLFGGLSNLMPAAIEAIVKCGLSFGGYRFRLACAHDHSGALLYDCRFAGVPVQMSPLQTLQCGRERARRVRIVFLSPALFKPKGQNLPTFSPTVIAARFFEHSLGAAVKMHQACSGTRLPWVNAPSFEYELVSRRLFRYDLPRHSFRQDKWLDFDGVIGHMDLAGKLDTAMPWARAAEVMYFGQKAAFGQGAVRVMVLE